MDIKELCESRNDQFRMNIFYDAFVRRLLK